MSVTFDAYHKWLGILPKDQPPHHYRLLGLEPFEDDLQVIEAAADRQLGFLRKFQSGEHAADCQKLLNEVTRARLCLLKPATKGDYDQELREKLAAPTSIAIEFEPEIDSGAVARPIFKPGPVVWISAGALLLLLLGVVGYFFTGGQPENQPVPLEVVKVNEAATGAGSSPVADGVPVITGITGTTKADGKPSKQLPAGTTNVLPLLKTENILMGSWDIKPDRLESLAYNQHAQVALPIAVPEEYTLHIRGTRLAHPAAPSQLCVVGLVCGDSNCLFVMEADPRNGGSGLENVDGMNWNRNSTTLPGLRTKIGQPFQLDAIVRKEGIEIRIDDRTIVDWKGSFHRLKRPPGAWDVADHQRLYLAAESKYVFTEIALGPPLPRQKLPGGDLKPGDSVELLKFVDLKRDVWNGVWEKHGLAMKNAPGHPTSRFAVPYQVPDEYELVADIECEGDGRDFVIGVPFQSGQAGIGVGGGSGSANCLLIDYAAFYREPHIAHEEAALLKGKNRVVVTVRKNHLAVKVNDRTLFAWKGDPRRYIAWPEYANPGQRVTVGSNGFSWQTNSLKLTRLAPSADVFSKPAEPKNGDLLAIVDVVRDTTHGEWKKTEKGVESSSINSAGLLFPAKLPANYEFRLVAERKVGEESLLVTLPVAGKAVMFDLGFSKGMRSGISWFEGKKADANSTSVTHPDRLFRSGQFTVVSGRVEGRHLRVAVDGKQIWDLDIPDTLIDPSWMVRPGWLTPAERLQLFVVSWETAFELQEVRFRPLDSQSPPFPPLNLASSSSPSSVPVAVANPDPSAGTMPVPDAAAHAAAAEKLREIFNAEFASAKKDADKLSLSHKLESLADDSGNDPAAKFVCLEEARKLAAEAGDLTKAFAQIDKACAEFKLDELELKASTLKLAAAKLKGPLLNKELVDKALPLIDQLVAAEKFNAAEELVTAASQAGLKVKDRALMSDLNDLRKGTGTLAKEFATAEKARITLQTSPDDAPANLAWGQWVCLHRGKWDEGLQLLQRSGNKKVQDLAIRDLQNPSKKEDRQQLGADWLEYAKSRKDHSLAGFADRAEFWLSQALPDATGLAKTRVESLIAEAVAFSDWDSPLPAVIQSVSEKIMQKRYVLSDQITGGDGYDFEQIFPAGGLLVGLNVYIEGEYIFGLQPVFVTAQGIKVGEVVGKGRGVATEIRARPGYSINGVACQMETGLTAIQVSFARITRSGLDLKRTYSSSPVGKPFTTQLPRSLSSGSQPIVGLTGRRNDYLRGLGLVIAR